MTKTFKMLTPVEEEQWLSRAELFHDRGMFVDVDLYRLAEILYNKSQRTQDK